MKNLGLFAFAVMLFTACQSDDLATPFDPSEVTARAARTRTFNATLDGIVNPAGEFTACTGDVPVSAADYFLTGNVPHFGNLNSSSGLHHESCNLSIATMLLTTSVSGQIVAANGDLVYYTGDDVVNVFNLLTASGTTGPITGTWTINGGTGRFEGASGSITISGLVDFTTFNFRVEANGTINY